MARHASRVIAFEANPQVAAFTRKVVPRNVEVVNVALSSQRGRTTLHIPRGRKGEAISELATIEARNPHSGATDSIEVEMKRLDDCGVANCSFIKIDVEGHEEAVLDGASALIAAQRPVLMVELDEGLTPGAVARFTARCAAAGYRGLFLSHGKLRPIATFVVAQHQDPALLVYSRKTLPTDREYINNFVFVPEEKWERLASLCN
jgi:FkbM family methyltransferase